MKHSCAFLQKRHLYLAREPELFILLFAVIVLSSLGGILSCRLFETKMILYAMIGVSAILVIYSLDIFEWVLIDEEGITLYSFLRRKRTLPWEKVCCSGFFFHRIHAFNGKRKKYFYFSRKPLIAHYKKTWEYVLPKLSEDFVFVAKQGNIEEMIEACLTRKCN